MNEITECGQYMFKLEDNVERMGIFTRVQDRDAWGWFSIQQLAFINVPGPVEDIRSPVLLELQHVKFLYPGLEAHIDNITIITNIYIVHADYFVDRTIPFRQGMENIAAIHERKEFFPPYNYEDTACKHINEEHAYLCSRIAICEVCK